METHEIYGRMCDMLEETYFEKMLSNTYKSWSKIWNNIKKKIKIWLVSVLKKMFEQGKKRQRIYDLLNAETKPK